MATPTNRKMKRLSLFGALPDMRDWGSGPGLGGWGAEGEPGASATRPEPARERRPDERILEDVRAQVQQVRQTDVEVVVEDGAVLLTGIVPNWDVKRTLHELVEHVSGVRDVSNRLRVGPPDPKTTWTMGSE